MNMTEIKKLAKQKGIDPGLMKKAELIRAIQAAEGNPSCYGSDRKFHCPEINCLWEKDCKKEI
jgi:hypothetical protein